MGTALLLFQILAAPEAPVDVAAYLAQDGTVASLHQGYAAVLSADPELREAERQYWRLQQARPFAEYDAAFDEALQSDPVAQALFLQFYDGLHRDGDVRAAYEQLQYITAAERRQGLDLASAMEDWQADPAAAIRFFESPAAEGALPPAVKQVLPYLRRRPELLGELGGLFARAQDSVQFDARVLPWWKHAAPFDAKHKGAIRRLTQYFLDHPEAFRAWHRRNTQLAADAQLRSWILYWQRVVRRDDVLRTGYAAYVASDDLAEPVDGSVEWPPKEAPPGLKPFAVTVSDVPAESLLKTKNERHIGLDRSRSARPEIRRPEVKRPAMPTMPIRPERPPKPEGPAKPEKPTKPEKEGLR